MTDKLTQPDRETMLDQVHKTLLPAYLAGLATVKGPIDDEDRLLARKIIIATETRESLAIVMPGVTDDIWQRAQRAREWAQQILIGKIIY